MKDRSVEIFNGVLNQYPTSRAFARIIGEDAADVIRWRFGRSKIRPRAVIQICKLHPEIKPYELNAEVFPKDLIFMWSE